jgi:formylglycine-generating enzyme required for sulfatase activity
MNDDTLQIGDVIGAYVVTSIVARDGLGVTYLGNDSLSVSGAGKVRLREVFPEGAVRRLKGSVKLTRRKGAKEQFEIATSDGRRLAETLARLDHPSLPRLRDGLELNGTYYIIVDEPEGEPLASILLQHGAFPLAQMKAMLMLLLPALEALHASGLVHGKIALGSIIRLDDGYPALIGVETARVSGDPSGDVAAIGAACEALITSESGLLADGRSLAKADLRFARALDGAANKAGAAPVRNIQDFRRLALGRGPLLPHISVKPLAAGLVACGALALVGNAVAAQGGEYKFRMPEFSGFAAPQSKPQAVNLPAPAATASASKVRKALPAAAAWNAVDRNDVEQLRRFLAANPKSEFADLAAERISLMDERAWLLAEGQGTREAYGIYLKTFGSAAVPAGLHADDAAAAREKFSAKHVFRVAEARRLLGELGYTLDAAKGETPALIRAVRKFELAQKRKVSGDVTPALIAALEAALGASGAGEGISVTRVAGTAPGGAVTPGGAPPSPSSTALAAGPSSGAMAKLAPVPVSAVLPPVLKMPTRKTGDTFSDCAECPQMIVVGAGKFEMGAASDDAAEGPVHTVNIARPFAVGRFEITVGQYKAFLADADKKAGGGCAVESSAAAGEWKPRDNRSATAPGFSQASDHPVTCTSWNDAQSYIAWLNAKTGFNYRLLSEAEWEYTARAGSRTTYTWGDALEDACGYANVPDRSAQKANPLWETVDCKDGAVRTAKVGSYRVNAFGVFDMAGNVAEWVEDCYRGTYDGAPSDGTARGGSCKARVVRGGGWASLPEMVRSAGRTSSGTGARYDIMGFRVARDMDES